jgi:hypothetical protein
VTFAGSALANPGLRKRWQIAPISLIRFAKFTAFRILACNMRQLEGSRAVPCPQSVQTSVEEALYVAGFSN